MTDPTDVIKLEGEGDEDKADQTVSKRRTNPRAQPNNPAVKLNPKNFDWFLQGIDQERLEGMLKPSAIPNEQSAVKLEETFALVRDGDDAQQHDLNDVSMAFGGLNQLENDGSGLGVAIGGVSAFRELPGDEMDDAFERDDFAQ